MAKARKELQPSADYDSDGYSWALEQAALLRARRFDLIDIENIAEEIESLGKSFADELYDHYERLLAHLLIWQFVPEQRSYGWMGKVRLERVKIVDHLQDNPGLKTRQAELFDEVYPQARLLAVIETDLPPEHFPEACPYSLEQAMDPEFWPGGRGMPARATMRRCTRKVVT